MSARAASNAQCCAICGDSLDAGAPPQLFERRARRLVSTCPACATSLAERARGRVDGPSWARVVTFAEELPEARLREEDWEALGGPVRLAWLTVASDGLGSRSARAVVPTPTGPIEASLPEGALDARVPTLSWVAPDVEGLLAWDLGAPRAYRVSVDHAYRIVALALAHGTDASPDALARELEAFVAEATPRRAGGF